jgi:hypothetical protein
MSCLERNKIFSKYEEIVSCEVTQKIENQLDTSLFMRQHYVKKLFFLSDAKFNRAMDQIEKLKTHKIIKNSFANVFLKRLNHQFKMKISFDSCLNHLVK